MPQKQKYGSFAYEFWRHWAKKLIFFLRSQCTSRDIRSVPFSCYSQYIYLQIMLVNLQIRGFKDLNASFNTNIQDYLQYKLYIAYNLCTLKKTIFHM